MENHVKVARPGERTPAQLDGFMLPQVLIRPHA